AMAKLWPKCWGCLLYTSRCV
ncbi:hypothetical protein AZZ71_001087, partial [Klebsiella pneumoniae]